MKVVVTCPKCKTKCVIVLEKTLSLNKDILAQCPKCKMIIPVQLYELRKNNKW